MRLRTAKKDYMAAVERTKEYIAAGDIFQAVLSQRFDVEPGVDTFQVYRALRTVNPSPYMFFLRLRRMGRWGEPASKARPKSQKPSAVIELAGSSPELLVRVHQGKVEYRPIAGTRPRGATEKEDRAGRRDAARREGARRARDAGRSGAQRCGPGEPLGSVKVDKLMFVERYSHVMHIVSSIEGQLGRS